MSPGLEQVLRALGDRGLRRNGKGWQARCPAHDDSRASLSINEGTDGRALLHCHAGCDTAVVVSGLGLKLADLMPPRTEAGPRPKGAVGDNPRRPRVVATYDYCDERGELLYQVIRREPKDFRQRRRVGEDWSWSLGDVRRVLYRLPDVLAAKKEEPAFIVEGEKDADALMKLGLCATTNAGGAGKWRSEYSEALRGRSVIILPDNDDPGRTHAVMVARALSGVAARLKVLELPGLPTKGDVSDWLMAGGTVAGLLALVDKTRVWTEPEAGGDDDQAPVFENVDEPYGTADTEPPIDWQNEDEGVRRQQQADAWAEPEALPEGLPTVPLFNERLLPDSLRPWLSDVAERTQCPPEFAAVGAMVALGAIVGRGCAIRPKRQDDWNVIPNLWGAVIGPPSSMKSPALTEALRPMKRLAADATELHKRLLEGHGAVLAEAKARRSVVEGQMKKAAKDGTDMAALRAAFETAADPAEPTERRYIVNDATVEKLGELLNENPRGLLHFRDEMTGWLATLDRDGHENDRAFFLEAWNGTGQYTYDRIGRGTLHIEAACVSMLGGIQPGPLAQYLRGAVRGGAGDDGLMQRFQLLVYPDPLKTWRNVDRWPDTDARNQAFDVFRRLDALTPETLPARTDDGPPFLRFDGDAQALFDGWREELMNRLRSGTEHPAMESHLAKYASLLPSIALVCHLADTTTPPGPVALESAERAAAWCDLLEVHARRVYDTVTTEAAKAAHAILGKLRSGKLGLTFSTRDVYRPQWTGLTDRQVVEDALATLEDHGWVRRRVVPEFPGRPRTEYEAHPSLNATKAAA